MMIKKYLNPEGELTMRLDNTRLAQKPKSWLHTKTSNGTTLHSVTRNDIGNYAVDLLLPSLTDLELRDLTSIKKLLGRNLDNVQYNQHRNRMHQGLQNDINVGTIGGLFATTLAGITIGFSPIVNGAILPASSYADIVMGTGASLSLLNDEDKSWSSIAHRVPDIVAGAMAFGPLGVVRLAKIAEELAEATQALKNAGWKDYEINFFRQHPKYTPFVDEETGALRGKVEGKYKVKDAKGNVKLVEIKPPKGANDVISDALLRANAKKARMAPLQDVRKTYNSTIQSHIQKGGLDWNDQIYLNGMGEDLKNPEWLKRYYQNVEETIIPLEKQLKAAGKLKKEGRIWYGEINGRMKPVDPHKYVVSLTENFKAAGLQYGGYQDHLTSGIVKSNVLNFGYSTGTYPVYTVLGIGEDAEKLRTFYTGWSGMGSNGSSNTLRILVPIIDRMGTSEVKFIGDTESVTRLLPDGTKAAGGGGKNPLTNHSGEADVVRFKGSDKGFRGIGINIYNQNQGTNSKSWWNNLDFAPGKGGFASIKLINKNSNLA